MHLARNDFWNGLCCNENVLAKIDNVVNRQKIVIWFVTQRVKILEDLGTVIY